MERSALVALCSTLWSWSSSEAKGNKISFFCFFRMKVSVFVLSPVAFVCITVSLTSNLNFFRMYFLLCCLCHSCHFFQRKKVRFFRFKYKNLYLFFTFAIEFSSYTIQQQRGLKVQNIKKQSKGKEESSLAD